MKISFYPDVTSSNIRESKLYKFSDSLRKTNPDLWGLMVSTLKSIENNENLDFLTQTGWIEHLNKNNIPLFEIKIPPTKRGGVVRLYCAYKKNNPNAICVLAAELKHVTKANKKILDTASKRYKEVCL